ncbi:MAG: DUF2330 domain-containing protein, partial [Myxococcales bacterium]|nr:DUF2330 domain-containing protein [Myxococcales bacterium]
VLAPAQARPCGGMIFPNHEQRVGGMSDQELLLAFAADRTVLVASAAYDGVDAADFAFLLPLSANPTEVLDADPALFIALDEQTAPRVSIYLDEDEAPGLGCGAKAAPGSDSNSLGEGGQVMVEQRGETATYQWVVLGGDTGTAIADWLTDEGYTLPPDYAAAIDPYVASGWFFFAAKVSPRAQGAALAPIELHLPPSPVEAFEIPFGIAGQSLLPGGTLGITTYVWSDGAALPDNQASGQIDPDEVVALSDSESNYDELERAVLEGDPDGTWLVDYSRNTSVEELNDAYGMALDYGRVDPATSHGLFIDAFFGRLGATTGHITRLRTELSAAQLHDLRLRRSADLPVTNTYAVTFREDDDASRCAVGRDPGRLPPVLLLLLPALLQLRPRRRRAGHT